MATRTFSFRTVINPFQLNTIVTAGSQRGPIVESFADGTWITAWSTTDVHASIRNANGTPRFETSTPLETTQGGLIGQRAAGIATISETEAIVIWNDSNPLSAQTVRGQRIDVNGNRIGGEFTVATPGLSNDSKFAGGIARINDGYVIAWSDQFSLGFPPPLDDLTSTEPRATIYNFDGSIRSFGIDVSSGASGAVLDVIGLSDGDFIVAWATYNNPLNATSAALNFRRFNPDGSPQTLVFSVDETAPAETQMTMIALPGGGWAIAYVDDDWTGTQDITLLRYDNGGNVLSKTFVNVDKAAGTQFNPQLSLLPNGFIVVGWTNDDGQATITSKSVDRAIVDNDGNYFLLLPAIAQAEGLKVTGVPNGSGQFTSVYQTVQSGADGANIVALREQLLRTTVGDNTAETLIGDALADVMYGLGGSDTINAGAGADIIHGGVGNDTLIGGLGNDTYYVDAAGDVVTELTATVATGGIDRILTTVTRSLGANVEQIFLIGAAAINATGNALSNYIVGNGANNILNGLSGNDRMVGGAGNDLIIGGEGVDTLTGGAGLDAFFFNTASPSANRDVITDFVAADDTIRLENAIFTALGAATGTLAAAKFWASATGLAHDADDRIVYNTTTGALIYDVNGNGAGGAFQFATLSTKPTITAADFVVI